MEKEPRYEFPWRRDTEPYIVISTDYGDIELRPSNSELFLFPDRPEIDHVFIYKEELDDRTSIGYRLFREHVDVLGNGAFSSLCDALFEAGIRLAPDEVPTETDVRAYQESIKNTTVNKTVQVETSHIDEEFEFYINHEWK